MKYTLKQLWDMFPVAEKIQISFDDNKEINNISLYSNICCIGNLHDILLDKDTFPKCPIKTNSLMLVKPIDMTKYIGKVCAFYDEEDEYSDCNFYFDILAYIDDGEYKFAPNSKLKDSKYKYCIPAQTAMDLLRLYINDHNQKENIVLRNHIV